jgi:hypothetical protein
MLIFTMNFHTSDIFSLQKPNECKLLFGICGEWRSHIDDTNGAKRLNGQHNNNKNEIPCISNETTCEKVNTRDIF